MLLRNTVPCAGTVGTTVAGISSQGERRGSTEVGKPTLPPKARTKDAVTLTSL